MEHLNQYEWASDWREAQDISLEYFKLFENGNQMMYGDGDHRLTSAVKTIQEYRN